MKETNGDFVAAIAALREKVLSKEKDIFFVDQTANPANPAIHEATTGPEIWDDTDGNVDILVANVGTGGTVSGTGKYLKSKNPEIKVVATDSKGTVSEKYFNLETAKPLVNEATASTYYYCTD